MPYRWTLTDLIAPYVGSEVLTKDPIGWDEAIYHFGRSEMYKGIFQEYTTQLRFHCNGGGKEYIDAIYQSEGIDGRIDILVEYDCDGSGTYDTLFNGIINLASYSTDGEYTTCNIESSDLLTKISMRDDISVDLNTSTSIGGTPITPITPEILSLNGATVFLENTWAVKAYPPATDYNVSSTNLYGGIITDGITRLSEDIGDSSSIIATGEITDPPTAFEDSLIDPIFQFVTNDFIADGSVLNYGWDFQGNLSAGVIFAGFGNHYTLTGSISLYVAYGSDMATATKELVFTYSGSGLDGWTTAINEIGSNNFILSYGDFVWLYWEVTNTTTLSSGTFFPDPFVRFAMGCESTSDTTAARFSININSDYNSTSCDSVLVHEAFNQVVDAIADGDGHFYSEFYGRVDSEKVSYSSDGCGSLVAITNGLRIRMFEKPLATSLKDLFTSFDALHNIGMGIENNTVRIEPLSYWFDGGTKILSLPNVNKYSQKCDNSKFINKVEIGYQKWESEFKGGLDDPCAKHEYSTYISSVKNTYSKLCKYLASPYSIETTRRKNIVYYPDTDWRHDNDIFLISLVRGAYGELIGEIRSNSMSSASGMIAAETAYNLSITPKRMLLAHLNVITSGLQLIKGLIKFVKGEGNNSLSATKFNTGCQEDYNAQPLIENSNIQWNDSNALNISPIWLPEIYSFEYPLTYTQFKAIKANPYGYIEFYKFADDVKSGFIMNMEYRIKNGMAKFELLRKY